MVRIPVFVRFMALVLLFAAAFLAAQQPGRTLLDQARARKAAGDLQGAADGFERVAADFATSDRNAATSALLELAEIFESLGQTERARILYERVRNDFKDQAAEVAVASERAARLAARSEQAANRVQSGNNAGPSRTIVRTPYADDIYSFAISPDGRTLVMQGTSPNGKKQLWRQVVGSSEKAEPIAGTEGAGDRSFPFFSPDGKTIGFFSGLKLWQVDLAGGTAKELADAPSPWGGAWIGSSIIMTGRGLGGQVEVVEDGKVRALPITSGLFLAPTFVDDRRFIFYRREGARGKLETGSLDGAPVSARGLPAAHAATFSQGYLLFVTQAGVLNAVRFDPQGLAASGAPFVVSERVGREDRWSGIAALSASAAGPIAFREAATVKRQMMWMGRAGDLLGTVGLADAANPGIPRVSPDGRLVLFFRQAGVPLGSVWVMDLATGAQSMFQDGATSAMWSPAGDQIVVSGLRGSNTVVLMTRPANAANNAGQIVGPTSGGAYPEDIAPNGAILYRAGGGSGGVSGGDLLVLPPNQGAPPVPVAQSAAAERNARFSADGSWIAYQSDESGRNEVYIQPFPGNPAQRQRLSLSGGVTPQWGRKGRELYFLSADNHLMVTTVESAAGGDRPSIAFSTPKALFSAPLPPGAEYETALDGDRFLIVAPIEDTPPIVVLSNWQPAR